MSADEITDRELFVAAARKMIEMQRFRPELMPSICTELVRLADEHGVRRVITPTEEVRARQGRP